MSKFDKLAGVNKFPIRKFREIVFQVIYAKSLSSSSEKDFTEFFSREEEVLPEVLRRAGFVIDYKETLDKIIAEHSDEYEFSRIGEVEKNILRLALYEMYYDEEVPLKVAISEAVRLNRKYGTREGGSFVNAILDKTQKTVVK